MRAGCLVSSSTATTAGYSAVEVVLRAGRFLAQLALQRSAMHPEHAGGGGDVAVGGAQCLLDVLPLEPAERDHAVRLIRLKWRVVGEHAQDGIHAHGLE